MSDIADKLLPRAEAIAMALTGVSDKFWHWGDYKKGDMKVSYLTDGGASIGFERKSDKHARIALTNVRPMDNLINRKAVDIPTGEPKTIDKASIPITNFDGVTETPVGYDARLSKLKTKEHAFALGFTESIKTTFGFQEGGEAASFKATQELELGFESRQDITDTEGSQAGEDRGAGLNPVCPPGYDITFSLERISQRMKTRLTGNGDVDFGFQIGKHDHGKFQGNTGEHGKVYPRWGKWDSWDEFMSVIKGEGRRDLLFAKWFWEHKASAKTIKALEKTLDLPFDHTGDEFDGSTVLKVRQTVTRGPKYESQRLVIEDELAASAM